MHSLALRACIEGYTNANRSRVRGANLQPVYSTLEYESLACGPLGNETESLSIQSADEEESSSARNAAMFWRMLDSSSRLNCALTPPSRNAALFMP